MINKIQYSYIEISSIDYKTRKNPLDTINDSKIINDYNIIYKNTSISSSFNSNNKQLSIMIR
jgi:hypothetical protein